MTWLFFLTGIYGVLLAGITVLNLMSADRFWLGALNLYMPQIMWGVPGLMLAFYTFKTDRAWTWLPLLGVLWVLGPIMGFCWPLQMAKPASASESLNLRVMTWNIKYGRYDTGLLIEELVRHDPDLVFFQDAIGSLGGRLGEYFKAWHVRKYGQYVIASRYPLSEAEVYELPSSGKKREYFVRCRMRVGHEAVSLYNVHFKTPRRSINAFRAARREPGHLPKAIEHFDSNVEVRKAQAASVLEYLSRERGPVILAGDLNAPDHSLVCATLRSGGLHDAFLLEHETFTPMVQSFLDKIS